jgi:hypothetical protein
MNHVLVIFQATQERMENMALAAGLGAVQSGASIRLRRLTPSLPSELGHKSYGTLHAADLQWADGVVIGVEAENPIKEFEEFTGLVHHLAANNTLAGKKAWAFGPEGRRGEECAAVAYLNTVMEAAEMILVEDAVPARESFSDATIYVTSAGQALANL